MSWWRSLFLHMLQFKGLKKKKSRTGSTGPPSFSHELGHHLMVELLSEGRIEIARWNAFSYSILQLHHTVCITVNAMQLGCRHYICCMKLFLSCRYILRKYFCIFLQSIALWNALQCNTISVGCHRLGSPGNANYVLAVHIAMHMAVNCLLQCILHCILL